MRVFARSFVCSFIHSFIQRMLTPSCYVQVAPGATRGAVSRDSLVRTATLSPRNDAQREVSPYPSHHRVPTLQLTR